MDLSISGASAPQKQSRSGVSPSKAQTRKPAATSSGYGQQKPSTGPKKSMVRAKTWTPEIEDLYRLQGAGWESLEEYIGKYGEPERWTPDVCPQQWISKLQIKQNGFFVYWKKHRECEDGSLNKVKIITYVE